MLGRSTMKREESHSGSLQIDVDVRRSGELPNQKGRDLIVEEAPVALVYNGVSHAVMMATPLDLEDFALGFSVSEGIIESSRELRGCDVRRTEQGLMVEMAIDTRRFAALKERRRSMVVRTGCGLCGTESLQETVRPVRPVTATFVEDQAIQRAVATMPRLQTLQADTGASHGAAWCTSNGEIAVVREDVGRHNALDKLIGALLKANTDLSGGFALVSSRASYEMVHKSCAIGIGCLVAISAPTSLAVEQARDAKQRLIGFARSGRHVIYNEPGVK